MIVWLLMALAMTLSLTVIAFAAWRHRVGVGSYEQAREIRKSEDRVLKEAADAVDTAYGEWLAEGHGGFTGPPPPSSAPVAYDDWFPFD